MSFEQELAELDTLEGIRIGANEQGDYIAWRTRPFLEPEFAQAPDPHREKLKRILKLALWALFTVAVYLAIWRMA